MVLRVIAAPNGPLPVTMAVALWLTVPGATFAQLPMPEDNAAAPDGATLFVNQCGTCHSVTRGDAPRQGPNLAGVFGRKAGTAPGFSYSQGFSKADWVWDEAHLQKWLTQPQDLIPGAVMLYRQPDPAIRGSIIAWLKEQR